MMTNRRQYPSQASLCEFSEPGDWNAFCSAVSLHAHSSHSREIMSDLPAYIAQIPLLKTYFERELAARELHNGSPVDFSKGWWQPPVSPRALFESEVAQIDKRFGLASIVSVTDHDNIDAGLELQQLYAVSRAPIAFEWTVPYGEGFFHLGVHNLLAGRAREWFARLAAFTQDGGSGGHDTLEGLLADLNAERELLLVFNHPMWDLAGVGADQHLLLVQRFLREHGTRLHALELNGYRSRTENANTVVLSRSTELPLISGGDRHGRSPNAILNLTRAQSFAEFANEVREGVSDVVFMPEYRQHLVARKLESAADVLRHYPEFPEGRRRWTDRVTTCDWEGDVQPLSYHWPDGGPSWVRSSVAMFRMLTSPAVMPVLRAAIERFDPGPGPHTLPMLNSQMPVADRIRLEAS
jgi:hypothetical protein